MVKPVLAAALLLLATVSLAHAKFVVESVNPGSPAAAAGMKAGDGIVRIDGREISTMDDLEMVMTAHQPGDKVPLTVPIGPGCSASEPTSNQWKPANSSKTWGRH